MTSLTRRIAENAVERTFHSETSTSKSITVHLPSSLFRWRRIVFWFYQDYRLWCIEWRTAADVPASWQRSNVQIYDGVVGSRLNYDLSELSAFDGGCRAAWQEIHDRRNCPDLPAKWLDRVLSGDRQEFWISAGFDTSSTLVTCSQFLAVLLSTRKGKGDISVLKFCFFPYFFLLKKVFVVRRLCYDLIHLSNKMGSNCDDENYESKSKQNCKEQHARFQSSLS